MQRKKNGFYAAYALISNSILDLVTPVMMERVWVTKITYYVQK